MAAEYIIATSYASPTQTDAIHNLECDVDALLKEGWTPTGGVAAIFDPEHNSITLMQAMLKMPLFALTSAEPTISFTSTVPFLGTLSGD